MNPKLSCWRRVRSFMMRISILLARSRQAGIFSPTSQIPVTDGKAISHEFRKETFGDQSSSTPT
jgi:hypothetical protein